MNPSVMFQLSHQCINPRKSCPAISPSRKPFLDKVVIIWVSLYFAPGKFPFSVIFIGHIPIHVATVGIPPCLLIIWHAELRDDIHLSEQQLTFQTGWRL